MSIGGASDVRAFLESVFFTHISAAVNGDTRATYSAAHVGQQNYNGEIHITMQPYAGMLLYFFCRRFGLNATAELLANGPFNGVNATFGADTGRIVGTFEHLTKHYVEKRESTRATKSNVISTEMAGSDAVNLFAAETTRVRREMVISNANARSPSPMRQDSVAGWAATVRAKSPVANMLRGASPNRKPSPLHAASWAARSGNGSGSPSLNGQPWSEAGVPAFGAGAPKRDEAAAAPAAGEFANRFAASGARAPWQNVMGARKQ